MLASIAFALRGEQGREVQVEGEGGAGGRFTLSKGMHANVTAGTSVSEPQWDEKSKTDVIYRETNPGTCKFREIVLVGNSQLSKNALPTSRSNGEWGASWQAI